jgi:hypothetical protein
VAVPVSSVSASIQIGDAVKFSRGSNLGSGGGVFDASSPTNAYATFKTFCVELTEHISFGPTYYVYGIGTTNNLGGKTLGTTTAWLYTKFISNDIALATAKDENAMQYGIWRGMGYTNEEIASAMAGHSLWGNYNNALNTYIPQLEGIVTGWFNTLSADFAAWASNGANYVGGVQIMNISTSPSSTPPAGTYAQDQLIWNPIPDPEPGTVPEPATVVIWGAMVGAGLVIASRRRAVSVG